MVDPDSLVGERARRLFRHAQELVRRQGIASLHGVQVSAGLITIHVVKRSVQRDAARNEHAVADHKFPYRLEIWQRKQVMLSVNYNNADKIEIAVFKRGVWEYRLPPLGPLIEPTTTSEQQGTSFR